MSLVLFLLEKDYNIDDSELMFSAGCFLVLVPLSLMILMDQTPDSFHIKKRLQGSYLKASWQMKI